MIRLKEDETYLSFAADGAASGDRQGVYRRDTRYLKTYQWSFGPVESLMTACVENRLHQHLAVVGADRGQAVAIERTMVMRGNGFHDTWTFHNTSREPRAITVSLDVEGDFRDLFASVFRPDDVAAASVREATAQGIRLSSRASDGVGMSVELAFSEISDTLAWSWTLAPGERRALSVDVNLSADNDRVGAVALPSYAEWRSGFPIALAHPGHQRALARAIDDVRMLLFTTPHGLYPAAGMPWFVNVFGRDALIVGMMLSAFQPALLLDILRLLAANQGRTVDAVHEEEPGKILHEMRAGELSRIGRLPLARYYGSVDATPLFLMALATYVEATGDTKVIAEFRPAWEAAVNWLVMHQASGDGLVSFAPSGSGLTIQSWKDSADSMNHADGSAAEAPLAVAEVQGYSFAAFRAAAGFYRTLGDTEAAPRFDARAQSMAAEFHQRFWIDDQSTYAMAIDAKGAPLAVLSSDPGHLLWSGIVPADIAPRLVETLLGDALWSGWGLRTLGKHEVRFNPVSYHNGSVWPHDTAIFAWGLSRYGFTDQLRTVATALFDLADARPDHRLPELIAGTDRLADLPPTSYTHACYPQAWAAAALPLLAGLLQKAGASL